MDVYVDVGRLHFKIDEVRNLHACRHQSFEGIADGFVEVAVLHKSSVDKEVGLRSFLLGRLWFAHEASDTAQRGIDLYGQQVLIQFLSKYIDDALAQ